MKLIFTLFAFLTVYQAQSQNCFTNFNYYRTIELKASVADSLIHAHSVAIPFNTKELFDGAKLRADGADFRVTDENCNELAFFVNDIETRTNNVLYVAVPDIETSGITLSLYYGDSTVSENKIDGDSVFEFFDDFEDGIVDEDKWEAIGQHSEWSEVGGEMRFTGVWGNGGAFQYVTPRMGFNDPMMYDFTANASNSQVYGLADTEGRNRIGLRYGSGSGTFDTLDIIAIMLDTLNGGTNPGVVYPDVQVQRGDMNLIGLSGFLDEEDFLSYTHFENYTSQGKNVDTLNIANMEFESLRPFFASFSSPIRVGFIGIRKAILAFPEIEMGEEEMLMVSSNSNLAVDFGIAIYPIPANEQINFKVDDINFRPVLIEVMSMEGKLITGAKFEENLNISTIPIGNYIVKLVLPEGNYTLDQITIVR